MKAYFRVMEDLVHKRHDACKILDNHSLVNDSNPTIIQS